MRNDVSAVARVLNRGGVAVYPTETLYALGCRAADPAASARVSALKGRPEAKPLPVIIGDMAQLGAVLADPAEPGTKDLARLFWPGPLSLVARAAEGLAPQAKDRAGMVSVRLTPHPLAARLCLECGPLVATSANLSGRPAASRPGELDPAVVEAADAAWLDEPLPGGGPPSTVARLEGERELAVLRRGAVAVADLVRAGFAVRGAGV